MNKCNPCKPVEPAKFVERRSGGDRRQKRFSVLRRLFNPGNRATLRRQVDRQRVFLLDYYSPRIFYAVTIVLLLSVTDALLTLWLLDDGARELNPVMAYFLKFGPMVFMAAKYVMTSASVVIVVLFNYICISQVRFPLGRLLHYFAGCFATVVVWELFLILRYVR